MMRSNSTTLLACIIPFAAVLSLLFVLVIRSHHHRTLTMENNRRVLNVVPPTRATPITNTGMATTSSRVVLGVLNEQQCPTSNQCTRDASNASCHSNCCCQGRCYDPTILLCTDNRVLCPTGYSSCSIACYRPTELRCTDDSKLMPLSEEESSPPEASSSVFTEQPPGEVTASTTDPVDDGDDDDDDPPSPSIDVGESLYPVENFSVRINVGGGQHTDSDGRVWQADSDETRGDGDNSVAKLSNSAISFTPEQPLYRSYRVGPNIRYTFPRVKSGLYRISVYWSENESVPFGFRPLTVSINGDEMVQGLDVLANAGRPFAPLSKTVQYRMERDQGSIELRVTTTNGNPAMLSAVELVLIHPETLGPSLNTASCNQIQQWNKASSSPVSHSEGAAVAMGTKLYLFAGFNSISLTSSPRVDAYDVALDKWEQRADFPIQQGITHMQSAAWVNAPSPDTARYIFLAGGFIGGNGGPATNKVFRYDVETDTYTEMPDLPEAMAAGSLVIDDNHQLHYISGVKPDRATSNEKHWSLDLTANNGGGLGSVWKEEPSMPFARNHIQGRTIGNRIYVSGGQLNHDPAPGTLHQSLSHVYDVKAQAWSQIKSQPMPRSHVETSSLVMNRKLVLVGGRTSNWDNAPSIIEYDPVRDAWSWLRSLPAGGRLSPAAGFFENVTVQGVKGNFIVVTCGMSDQEPFDTWVARVLPNSQCTYDSS